jgi:hypothetical protein
MEQEVVRRHQWLSLLFLAIVLTVSGCAHTLPIRSSSAQPPHRLVMGIKSFCDVNGFDYGPAVKSSLSKDSRFSSILLTADVNDPRCDYVIRGNFCHYRVGICTGFYYASIYFLWVPAFSGLPTSYFDGAITAEVEVYRKGALLKTFAYEDIFRVARSYITLFPTGVSLDAELNRVAVCFKADLLDLTRPEALQ